VLVKLGCFGKKKNSPNFQNEVKKSQFNLLNYTILERQKTPFKPLGLHRETSLNYTSQEKQQLLPVQMN